MTEDKENVVSKGSQEETLSSASAPKSNNTEATSEVAKPAGAGASGTGTSGAGAGHDGGSYGNRTRNTGGHTGGGSHGGGHSGGHYNNNNNSGGHNNSGGGHYNNRGGSTGAGGGTGNAGGGTGTGAGAGTRRPYQFNKRRFVFKKKECYFTKNNVPYVDYKDINLLKMFVGYNGQILISRFTGLKPKYQRRAAIAVKRARFMALLPFVGEVKKYNPRRDERQGQGGQGDFKPRGAHDDHNRAPIGGDASAVASATSAATSVPTSTPAPTTNDTAVVDKDNSASGVTNGE